MSHILIENFLFLFNTSFFFRNEKMQISFNLFCFGFVFSLIIGRMTLSVKTKFVRKIFFMVKTSIRMYTKFGGSKLNSLAVSSGAAISCEMC